MRGVPILSGVPEHALYQLMGVMQLRLVGKLRRLVKPYEPPKNFTLLICGGAEARDLDGQNFVTLAAGDSFGLEALGAGDSGTIILPSTRSVTTLSPVLLLQLPAYAAEAAVRSAASASASASRRAASLVRGGSAKSRRSVSNSNITCPESTHS